jgi:hypothetical protein
VYDLIFLVRFLAGGFLVLFFDPSDQNARISILLVVLLCCLLRYVRCSVKYMKDSKLIYLFNFDCRSLARGEYVSTRSFYSSRPGCYNETRGPIGGPEVVETLYNI